MSNAQTPDSFFFLQNAQLPTEEEVADLRANVVAPERTFLEKQLPSLVSATHSAEEVAKEFRAMSPAMRETVAAYQKSADSISAAAAQFTTLIEGIKGTLEHMPAVKPFLSKILDALTIVYDVVMACLNRIFYTVPTLIVRLFQLFGIDALLIKSFVASVVTFSCSQEIEQGTETLVAHGHEFIGLITKGLGTLILGRTPDIQQIKYVNDVMRYRQGITKEIKDMSEFALNAIQMIPDQLQIWMSYVVPTKWWLTLFAPGTEYFTWIDEVNSLDSHTYTVRAAFDHVVQQQILRLHSVGQKLVEECTKRGTRVPQVYRLLESTFKKLDALYKIVDMSALHRGVRRVPFVIYLSGATGQGKSFLMTVIPAILANCNHDEPNLAYSRNAAVDHWDGYTGQFAVKYDDFGAVNQTNASPGEMGELINIVSNEQMRLPMASLQDKGEVFRSQVVVISSNIGYLRPAELRDVTALHRRRHVFVEVRVKPEFRRVGRQEVDPALIPADFSHWEFIERDNFDPMVYGRTMNYQEFITDLRLKFAEHVQNQQQASVNYEAMIAAANVPAMDAHGLASDFELFMRANNALETCSQRTIYSGIEGDKFLRSLEEIDAQAETPKWVKAFYVVLPVIVTVGATLGLVHGIRLFNSRKEKSIKQIIRQPLEVEKVQLSHDEIRTAVGKLNLLRQPRVAKLDAEGRWNGLYSRIRGMTPELVDLWDESMDHEGSSFANLTDSEVEEVVDQTLRSPSVKKFLLAEGVYSGHHYKTMNRMTNLAKPKMTLPMLAEGCIDQNAMEVTTNRLVPHLAQISVDGYRMVCLFIGGRVLVTVSHVFCDASGQLHQDGVPIEIRIGSTVHRCLFNRESYVKIGQDVALYRMDATMPCFKDTVRFFIKDEDLGRVTSFPALMATVDRSGIPMIFKIESEVTPNTREFAYTPNRIKQSEMFNQGRIADSNIDDTVDFRVRALTAWSYKSQTYPGMCGSPIVMLDKFAARKIVGIHAAGNTQADSLAQPITQEMLGRGLASLGFLLQPADIPVDGDPALGLLQAHGNFSRLGVIFNHPRISERTRIIPSLLHGKIYPVKTAPAVLSNLDPRATEIGENSVLKQGIEKYGKPAPYVDMKILNRVIASMDDLFAPLEGGTKRRILTQAEALNGIQGDEFIQRMDMTTSAGWPWNRLPGVKGKDPYIKRAEGGLSEFIIADPKMQSAVDKRFQSAMEGKRVPSLWIDTLKDERRSLKRIVVGKTRVFTIPPVDYTIVCRRLFGAFNSAFYYNRLKFFSAVGIDPGGLEWTLLFNELNTMSTTGFAGDFSGWDGNLSPQFLEGVCRIVNQWYNDDEKHQVARLVLFDEIIHTPQCALNEVYSTHIGNPSGNPLTVIVNTIVHMMYLLYVYYKVAPPELNCYASFNMFFRAFIYGDDGIYAIKPEILSFYNPEVLLKEFALLNLDFTNATKTGAAELTPVKNLTFLKRGFRDDGFGRKLAIIDVQTITELVNWTRQCADLTLEQASLDNINDSLAFMYAYGKKAFDQHREKIKEALGPKYHVLLNDFMYYHRLFLSKVDNGYREVLEAHGDTGGQVAQPTSSSTPITTNRGEEIRISENTKGIIIQSQREEEVSGSTLEPLNTPGGSLQRQCVGDPTWGLKDIVNRRIWVNTYQWTAAQGMGAVVVKLTLPQDIITNYFQSAPFERFVFWRGSMTLEFQVTGMRQQLGCLKVFNVPFTHFSISDVWQAISPTTYYGLNPLSIDPSSNQPQKLIVPFTNPKTFLSINGPTDNVNIDFNSTVYVVVLVPLTAAAGSANEADLTVWASFGDDSEFHIPLNSGAVGRAYNIEHAKQLARGARFLQAHGGTVSSTNNITAYGNMDGTCIPQKLTADDFQGAASGNTVSVPAFDRAARTPNPFNVVRKYIQNFTNSKGSELVTRLDLDPSNLSFVTKDHFSTHVDEMTYSFLQCTPTWVANINWMGNQTAGTSLWSGFIGPMTTLFTQGTTNQVTITEGSPVAMTQWEYNSMRFAFWKGGMRVRFEIVATAFHVGRLCLTLNYGAPPGVAVGLRDATSQYAVQFELNNEKSVFEYDIPWVSSTPWKRMCRGPSSPDDPDVSVAWWNDYFLGSFDLSVVTQLKTVAAAPPDVVIIMSYSGSPDFKVYMPSNINATFVGTATQADVVPLTAHGDVGTRAGVDATPSPPAAPAMLVSATKIAPQGHRATAVGDHFGQTAAMQHSREELRRYYPEVVRTFYANIPMENPALVHDQPSGFTPLYDTGTPPASDLQNYVIFDVIENCPLEGPQNNTGTTYQKEVKNGVQPIQHHALQYRFWRGSQRYKILMGKIQTKDGTEATCTNFSVIHIPHGQYALNGVPSAVRANWAYIATTVANNNLTFQLSAGGSSIASTVPGMRYAQDWGGTGMVNYVEVETPFTVIYNVLMNKNALRLAASGNATPDVLMAGVLLIVRTFTLPYAATAYTANLFAPLTVLKSVGDDFRFGVFLGKPLVLPSSGAETGLRWPDTWVISTTPLLEVRKEEKQPSDDEFDIIPEKMTKSMLVSKLHKMAFLQAHGSSASVITNTAIAYWTMPRNTFTTTTLPEMEIVVAENMQINQFDTNYAKAVYFTLIANLHCSVFDQLKLLHTEHKLEVEVIGGVDQLVIRWKLARSPTFHGEIIRKDEPHNWDRTDLLLFRAIYLKIRQHVLDWAPGVESALSRDEDTSDPPIMFLQAHGSTHGDTLRRLLPTNTNFQFVITETYEKYLKDDSFMARSAMNEITQKIETAVFTCDFKVSGLSHVPTFTCEARFTAENTRYGHLKATQTSSRKKAAEEAASVSILEQLHALVPEEDVCSKPVLTKPIEEQLTQLNLGELPGKLAPFREFVRILQNLPTDNFLSQPNLSHLKEMLGCFGYQLEFKAWTQHRLEKILLKVRVSLISDMNQFISVSYNTLGSFDEEEQKETLVTAMKDAIWGLLESLFRGEMDYFVPLELKE